MLMQEWPSHNQQATSTHQAWGVYVHIPWCEHHCHYCNFNVLVEKTPNFEGYTKAVLTQWESLQATFTSPPSTLFLGGGRPSLHHTHLLATIIEGLGVDQNTEITLEANPGDISASRLRQWKDIGITRLSLGIQTFNPNFGRFLARGHTVEQSRDLVKLVADAGFSSWSVDILFAVPGQSLTDFQEDLHAICDTKPPHVSLYGLTAEPDTPYGDAVHAGKLTEATGDQWRAMYDAASDALQGQGFEQYEHVSFAQTGHRCLHNQLYWRGHHYAGLGAGAHGFLPDGRRSIGLLQPSAFIENPTSWALYEKPASEQNAHDLLISCLRHQDGVDLSALAKLGWRLKTDTLETLVERGMAQANSHHLRLTHEGWCLMDAVTLKLMDGLLRQHKN